MFRKLRKIKENFVHIHYIFNSIIRFEKSTAKDNSFLERSDIEKSYSF